MNLAHVLHSVTLNNLLIKVYVMAAKLIDLTDYRRSKQEKKRSKNAREPGSRSVGKGTHIIGNVRYTPLAWPEGDKTA